MKNVGIVTLFGEYNFGNRLQNYAVQQVLKKNGFNTETIKYIGLEDDVPIIHNERDENRLNKFKDFNKYIKFSDDIMYKEYEAPQKIKECYDYIVLEAIKFGILHLTKSFQIKHWELLFLVKKEFLFLLVLE